MYAYVDGWSHGDIAALTQTPPGTVKAWIKRGMGSSSGVHGMNPQSLDALAGDYVLSTLSAARRSEVEQQLSNDAVPRAAVQGWHEQLLPALAKPVEPSNQLWWRIEPSLGQAATQVAPSAIPAKSAAPAEPIA